MTTSLTGELSALYPEEVAGKADRRADFEALAPTRTRLRGRAKVYHAELERFFRFLIPRDATVLEIGCGTGDLLAAVAPSGKGVGGESGGGGTAGLSTNPPGTTMLG